MLTHTGSHPGAGDNARTPATATVVGIPSMDVSVRAVVLSFESSLAMPFSFSFRNWQLPPSSNPDADVDVDKAGEEEVTLRFRPL